MAVLGYLAKLKRKHMVCMTKNVPYLIPYQWTKFQCHTLFLSHDIKQNVLLSPYLGR